MDRNELLSKNSDINEKEEGFSTSDPLNTTRHAKEHRETTICDQLLFSSKKKKKMLMKMGEVGIVLGFVAMLGDVVVLGIFGVDCIMGSKILETCANLVPVFYINVVTVLSYWIMLASSLCLLLLCYHHAESIGFVGLKRHMKEALRNPKHLSQQLVMWVLTLICAIYCFVDFGLAQHLWGLAAMIDITLFVTNVMTTILAPLNLGPCHPLALQIHHHHRINADETEVKENDHESEQEVQEENEEETKESGFGDELSGLKRQPRRLFAAGLATALAFNLFYTIYDTSYVVLKLMGLDVHTTHTVRVFLLASSIAAPWYRALQAQFYYHKLLFPACDVFTTRFPPVSKRNV